MSSEAAFLSCFSQISQVIRFLLRLNFLLEDSSLVLLLKSSFAAADLGIFGGQNIFLAGLLLLEGTSELSAACVVPI